MILCGKQKLSEKNNNNNSLCQNTRHMDAQGRNTSGRNHFSISSLDVSGGIAIRPGPAGRCNIPIPQSSASSPTGLNGIALSVPPAAACLEVSLSWHVSLGEPALPLLKREAGPVAGSFNSWLSAASGTTHVLRVVFYRTTTLARL